MTRDNSPWYRDGIADGAADAIITGTCPGGCPVGHDPEKEWSVLYREGYELGFGAAEPHPPCKGCASQRG